MEKYHRQLSILRALMDANGLTLWKIRVTKKKLSAGTSFLKEKTIGLSSYYMDYVTDDVLRNTMLHEIAHAIDYEQRGYSNHDNHWKRIAMRIGATPSRAVTQNKEYYATLPSKYELVCSRCGYSDPAFRQPKRNYICGRCYKFGYKIPLVVRMRQ